MTITVENIAVLVLSVPAILALVNLLKAKPFKLKGDWAAFAAVVTGIVLNVLNLYFGTAALYRAIAEGAILGLAAAGFYDLRNGNSDVIEEHVVRLDRERY